MTKEDLFQLKYDFDCNVNTVYQFLTVFSLINGERAVYTALERYLDERKKCIVSYIDNSL